MRRTASRVIGRLLVVLGASGPSGREDRHDQTAPRGQDPRSTERPGVTPDAAGRPLRMCPDRRGHARAIRPLPAGQPALGSMAHPHRAPHGWEMDDRVARCRFPERSATAGPTRSCQAHARPATRRSRSLQRAAWGEPRPFGPAFLVVLPQMTYLAIVSGSGHPVSPCPGDTADLAPGSSRRGLTEFAWLSRPVM
jgi:hypothetical protein